MKPGEIILSKEKVVINQNRETVTINVTNIGDRPIQVGSHYHFFETNKELKFNREEAFGFHLDIPSGNSVRFEPGEEKVVHLVKVGGKKVIVGFNNLVDGEINEENKAKALEKAKEKGFY